jgi:hypothetical protein
MDGGICGVKHAWRGWLPQVGACYCQRRAVAAPRAGRSRVFFIAIVSLS